MPKYNCITHFGHLLSSLISTMFLVCKFHEYKRQQTETNKTKVTENELTLLNHKINKLLIKLEEEHEQELAKSHDEECVICISAKATMQTFPCAHRVVCRKCFVKTIQMAVSQRMLPLRCVICRSKILRLKQTSHGGLNTGHVLRTSRSYLNTNPFYISPANSPVSPVTEVFREQQAVFVRHYIEFGYDPNGKSPVESPSSQTQPKTGSSNSCVLHKHCNDKSQKQSSSQTQTQNSSSHSSSPQLSPQLSPQSQSQSHSSSPNTECSAQSVSGSSDSRLSLNSGTFQWQFNRKRKYSRTLHGRRRGNKGANGRPNSLLLPIDESEELQELLQTNAPKQLDENGEIESISSASNSLIDGKEETNNGNDITANYECKTSSSSSRLSTTLLKAKEWMKKGKWIAH